MKQQIDIIAMWVSFVLFLLLFKPAGANPKHNWTEVPLVPKSTNEVVLFIPATSHDKKYHKTTWQM